MMRSDCLRALTQATNNLIMNMTMKLKKTMIASAIALPLISTHVYAQNITQEERLQQSKKRHWIASQEIVGLIKLKLVVF